MLKKVGEAWSECFESNSCIQHLNLRHNNFCWQQLEIISYGLEGNDTILTLNLSGNEGHLDENGLLAKGNDKDQFAAKDEKLYEQEY